MISLTLLTWIGLALVPAFIASTKGRSGIGYFLLGLALPLISIIIAIGVSDNRLHRGALGRPMRGSDRIICEACRRPKRADATSCPHCGKTAEQAAHAHQRKCPSCAEWILAEAKKCKHCGEVLEPARLSSAGPRPVGTAPAGLGYCQGCSKLRGYEVAKCIYCGDTAPVGTMPPAV